jgi:hypothetical protein
MVGERLVELYYDVLKLERDRTLGGEQ